MYNIFLPVHSLFRWLVLAALLISIVTALSGWLSKRKYTKTDISIKTITVTIVHIQLLLGLTLYIISPIVNYFIHNFKTAVHLRQIRFFGMEHSLMMFIAIIVLTIGSVKVKRKQSDLQKFKTQTIWFIVALLIILSSVPWQFSPLIARPNFRPF